MESRRFCNHSVAARAAGIAQEKYVSYGDNPLRRALAWRKAHAQTWMVLVHEHTYPSGAPTVAKAIAKIVPAPLPPWSRSRFTRMLESRGHVQRAAIPEDGPASHTDEQGRKLVSGRTYEVVPRSRAVARLHHAITHNIVCFAHEVASEDPCAFFADVDISRAHNAELDCEALFARMLRELSRLLVERCSTTSAAAASGDAPRKPPRFRLLDSSTPAKFSRHIVCVNSRAEHPSVWAGIAARCVYACGYSMWIRTDGKNANDPRDVRPALDFSVYELNHPMRTLGSAKRFDERRVLREMSGEPVTRELVAECFFTCPPPCPPGTPIGGEAGFYYVSSSTEAEVAAMHRLGYKPGGASGYVNVPLRSSAVCRLGPDTSVDHGAALREIIDALQLPCAATRLDIRVADRTAHVRTLSKACEIKGSAHGSRGTGGNHIFYKLHLSTCKYRQGCHCRDCDQRKAQWHDFPPAARALAEAFVATLPAVTEEVVEPPPRLGTTMARMLLGAL